jgi:indole-3-glycerol phosphate synthase
MLSDRLHTKPICETVNILDKIIAQKYIEVEQHKAVISIHELGKQPNFERQPNSLKQQLEKAMYPGIIAEFKRRSPSKGDIHANAVVDEVVAGYEKAGAVASSVLTDVQFFGGSPTDLQAARRVTAKLPLLRKDFVIDEYQLYEARAWGADLVLLIAASLNPKRVLELAQKAKELQLEVLMEVHSAEELNCLNPYIDLVGVNNRNLKTFEVGLKISEELADVIPGEFVRISESGIDDPENVACLWRLGYKGFLIGENFMKTACPEITCREFIAEAHNKVLKI